jgi:glycosyltransferase involved in cell wall biosynthesis
MSEQRAWATGSDHAVFFVKTADPQMIPLSEFYAVDMRILSELGFEVRYCGNPLNIPRADLYFVWWWTWAIFPLIRAKLSRKPVVIVGTFDHVTDGGALVRFPKRPRLHQYLIRLALKLADANIVCSPDQFEAVKARFAPANLTWSPHVLDTTLYKPSREARSDYFLSICWMTSGNVHRKCILELVRAFALVRDRFPERRLKICGRKESGFSEVVALVNQLGLRESVDLPGLVTREEKIDLLQHCAAYLQPSSEEGFGVAILEAMACGAPVITSDVGPVRSIAADTAHYVDGRNPSAIADAMMEIASRPELSAEMGARAAERARSMFPYERRKADIERVLAVLGGRVATPA